MIFLVSHQVLAIGNNNSLTDRAALVMSGTSIPEKSTFHEGLQLGLNSVLGLSMLNAVE